MTRLFTLLGVALLVFAGGAGAANIGQWDRSDRSWNHPQISQLRALLISRGHQIEADGPLSAAALANDQVFVIAEPLAAPTSAQGAALAAFVQGGGVVLVLGDVTANTSFLNAVVSAAGSTMTFTASGPANAPIVGGSFAGEGPPQSIVGQTLTVSTGLGVSGGNAVAGAYVRYQAVGSGFVFAFGDRLDHDSLVSAGGPNGQLFLNIVTRGQVASQSASIPTLSSGALALVALAVALVAAHRLRRT